MISDERLKACVQAGFAAAPALGKYTQRLHDVDNFTRAAIAQYADEKVAATGQETALLEAITKIAMKASGGLTSFSSGGKHAFLMDIARMCVELGFDVPALHGRKVARHPDGCARAEDGNES